MSQTNEFAKANNPDFVYFDLQSHNIYNNETGETPPLQFLESRDAPVIDNAGEYNMSVTRFSVDTGNLPVLVVEPDLKGIPDPYRSIHKVAIITKDVNFTLDAGGFTITTDRVDTETATTPNFLWGQSVASSQDGEVIVFGEPNQTATKTTGAIYGHGFTNDGQQRAVLDAGGTLNATGRGQVYMAIRNIAGTYDITNITQTFGVVAFDDTVATNGTTTASVATGGDQTILVRGTITSNWNIGINVAISLHGNRIFIGSGAQCPFYYMFDRESNIMYKYNKLHNTTTTRKSKTNIACNCNGSKIVVGYPDMIGASSANVLGSAEILTVNEVGVATSTFIKDGAGGERKWGLAVAMNWSGELSAITRQNDSNANGTIHIYNPTGTVGVSYDGSYTNFGNSVSITNSGEKVAVGASTANTAGRVIVLPITITGVVGSYSAFSIGTAVVIDPNTYTLAIGFGSSVDLSQDGTTINIGAPSHSSDTGLVQTFMLESGSWVYKTQSLGTVGSKYGTSIGASQDGIHYVVGAPATTTTRGFVAMNKVVYNAYHEIPNNLPNSSSVVSVFWGSDTHGLIPPSLSQLTGTNTAIFPFYYCHSYSNFIDRVNTAIREAYVANFNRIWNEYVSVITASNREFIKAEFVNIVARCFSTPPFMEWTSSLTPTLYLNNLFSWVGNYYNPTRSYSVNGTTQVSTTGRLPPIVLELAFNASLYALFGGFPAIETTINNEKFYIIKVASQVATLRDNSTIPLRSLSLIPDYPFLYPYHNNATGVLTLPFPTDSVASFSLQDYFIELTQEISTIDAWCPVSSIVFTSNQLPIIVSQFSSFNTTGTAISSATIGNRFALVITDIMTNQQGFRPNLIYNPSAEYRRIALTGNMAIRNIDINVFWRSKTGQLLPFRLQSGGSATLKLLFEKKNRNPEKIIEPPINEDIMGGRMRSRR